MIFKGLRFGMLLQLAVGPVCFLVFRASAGYGFWSGLQVALAATLVDAAFVALSGAGVAAFMSRAGVKAAVRWIGCLVLALFGANIILSALDIPFLPEAALFTASGGSFFMQGFVLTAGQPAHDHLLERDVHRADDEIPMEPSAAFFLCRGVRAVHHPVADAGRRACQRARRLPA